MEYFKAEDIRNIIWQIEPCSRDYAYQGMTEIAVLDRQKEIAEMLKNLSIIELEDK